MTKYESLIRQFPTHFLSLPFQTHFLQAEVYRKCSNGQLTFEPASSSGAWNGVKDISLSSSVYCGKNWWDVSNDLNLRKSDYNADFMMFVMPDCVDFEGAAGWGQTPGDQTWYPSSYASLPVVQVHEMGHNFGHSHSGKNGIPYGDDTGYMGNQALWTDVGSAMCFNAAKTWFFKWYPALQKIVEVTVAEYITPMVGVGQIELAQQGVDMVIVKVKSERSNAHSDLYINFNSAMGSNSGVRGDRNALVITEQKNQWSQSNWIAALGDGESHTIYNWGVNWETLVIKNCGISWSTPLKATLVVAKQGSQKLSCTFNADPIPETSRPTRSPTRPPTPWPTRSPTRFPTPSPVSQPVWNNNPDTTISTPLLIDDTKYFNQNNDIRKPSDAIRGQRCEDVPGWYDSDGEEYDCIWYSIHTESCHKDHPNMGRTARTACCACGGGNKIYLYDPKKCQDTEKWTDSKGKDCSWYERDPEHCLHFSLKYSNMGQTARQACCYCKEYFGMVDR